MSGNNQKWILVKFKMNFKKKHISILGLGNISLILCRYLINKNFIVSGVTDDKTRKEKLSRLGVKVYSKKNVAKSIQNADTLIITTPPDLNGCPIIRNYSAEIIKSNINWIGYLSSTAVYGNHYGKAVDENSELNPQDKIAFSRLKGEQDVLALQSEKNFIIEIFRISGIYGINRNVFRKIISNNIRPIYKKNHFFNRIHEEDIAKTLVCAAFSSRNSGIINLSDDLPSSQLDIVLYASRLLNIQLPKVENYDEINNSLEASIKKYWDNNKKINNSLFKERYGSLMFPTYKEGLLNIYKIMFSDS